MRKTVLFAALAAAACSACLAAEPAASSAMPLPSVMSRADEQAIRQVVQGQLDALAADDAKAAFAFATIAIREQFGSAGHFLEMIRAGYPVVYRPTRVVFLKPEQDRDAVTQGVEMTDADGAQWLATYLMQREAGRWRIGGCVVMPNRSLGT